VLYKEKNMLLTEANIHRRGQMYLPQPDRLQKVKKSMGAIKAVLGERKRDAIAQTALKQAMMEEQWKGSESGELEK
jgi:large subunit ribosomal protein L47